MSRTARYKAFYVGIVAGGAALALWLALRFHMTVAGVGLLAVVLLLPGRILGFFWRDLLRGLRLLDAGHFAESKRHSERFLADLKRRPWLKKLIWLGSGSYSRDAEALALNNLDAAELMLGEFDDARRHLDESMAVDRLNPLPFFNQGKLCMALGDEEAAAAWFKQAAALGFSLETTDRLVMSAQQRFAGTHGRGST